jgi:hypothetical protein
MFLTGIKLADNGNLQIVTANRFANVCKACHTYPSGNVCPDISFLLKMVLSSIVYQSFHQERFAVSRGLNVGLFGESNYS